MEKLPGIKLLDVIKLLAYYISITILLPLTLYILDSFIIGGNLLNDIVNSMENIGLLWVEKSREVRVCGKCGLMIIIQPKGYATVNPTVEDYINSVR